VRLRCTLQGLGSVGLQYRKVAQLCVRLVALVPVPAPRMTRWERAERLDVREFVEWLREAPNPRRLRPCGAARGWS
jgi:hypothetical protein